MHAKVVSIKTRLSTHGLHTTNRNRLKVKDELSEVREENNQKFPQQNMSFHQKFTFSPKLKRLMSCFVIER